MHLTLFISGAGLLFFIELTKKLTLDIFSKAFGGRFKLAIVKKFILSFILSLIQILIYWLEFVFLLLFKWIRRMHFMCYCDITSAVIASWSKFVTEIDYKCCVNHRSANSGCNISTVIRMSSNLNWKRYSNLCRLNAHWNNSLA